VEPTADLGRPRLNNVLRATTRLVRKSSLSVLGQKHIGQSDALDTRQQNPTGASKPGIRVAEGLESVPSASTGFGLLKRVLILKDNFFLNFLLLFLYVLIMNREGFFVPSNNESLYLLQLAKLWNPNLLVSDWTFSGPLFTHFVFNFIFGPLTLLFSLEVVGWIGRILSWSLILVAVFQLGKHFRIPLWMITASTLLWLFYGQSIVGGEWILGTFEAKCIAYALLFFSLNGFMQQRLILPSILLGLALSFHPLVGVWGALAVGFSLIVLKHPFARIAKIGCYTTLFALPGLIPLLMMSQGPAPSEELKFLSLVVIPYHLDPFYFASSKLFLLLLGMLLCFNWLQFGLEEKSDALRFLIFFQTFLGLFFILGFLARFAGNYDILMLMPCRLFPVLLPLFFFFQLSSALHLSSAIKMRKGLVMFGCLALVMFGNPVDIFVDVGKKHYSMWTRLEPDWEKAFKWIEKNTPTNSIIISPPWRGESFYLSRRGQIASWWVPRFDRLTEWRTRLESLIGDVGSVRPGSTKARLEHMAQHYNNLTTTELRFLADKYGAEYLVSSGRYSYPVLFHSGTYTVYSLTAPERKVFGE
jgi:hypothetical protein